MTKEADEIPLFMPGPQFIATVRELQFVCNINGELSLWRTDNGLRVYTDASYGTWLETKRRLMRQVEIATDEGARRRMPMAFAAAQIIARNAEALSVYMDMLSGSTRYGSFE